MPPKRSQQVVQEQVLLSPDRYPTYREDLISLLNMALRSVSDGAPPAKRRKELSDGIKAKTSQMPAGGGTA